MRRPLAGLLLVVAAACGGDGDGGAATSAPASTTTTATTTTTVATTTTLPVPIETSADVADAFAEAVADHGVRRWDADEVTVAWHGAPSADDRLALQAALAWLAGVAGVPGLTVVADGTDADVDLHVLPQAEWAPVVGEVAPDDVDVTAGLTLARWEEPSGAMTGADVVIDATLVQVRRNRTIVHELLHALGLGHHSCAGGLVYGGLDATPSWTPTAFDTDLVRLTYEPTIPSGASAAEASARLAPTLAQPTCPLVLWVDAAAPDGTVLWCERDADPARCYVPTATAEPVPGGEPDRWSSGGTLTVYDPSRYVAYDTPDGPVLCEVPVPGTRVPCQRGADLRTVEVAELWTDGDVLYDEP